MWQTVISFDNRWLEKYGLYDPEEGLLDELKLKEDVSGAVDKMLTNEALENAVWSAAIHFNTDNIHIHVATVEMHPERAKKEYVVYRDEKKKIPLTDANGDVVTREAYIGRFKGRSLELCKKYIVDNITQQQEQNIEINRLIRDTIVKQKKNMSIASDPDLCKKFLDLYDSMPQKGNHGLWNYNNNIMIPLRPKVDALSRAYLRKYHAETMEELGALLRLQDETYRLAYGKDSSRSFYQNKIDELYERLGNAILKEIRGFHVQDINHVDFSDGRKKADIDEHVDDVRIEILEDDTVDYGYEETMEAILPDSVTSPLKLEWSVKYKKARELIYGKKKDFKHASVLLNQEAWQGNILAIYDLGNMYEKGIGVGEDKEAAQTLYVKAFEGFSDIFETLDAETMNGRQDFLKSYVPYRMGKMFLYGQGTEQDYQNAFQYFSLSADLENKYASYYLGKIRQNGWGIEKDLDEALTHYEKASGTVPYAAYEAGNIYKARGQETQAYKCYQSAFKQFQKVNQKNPDDKLQYRIGYMLYNGMGVEKSIIKAEKMLLLSAEANNKYAKILLAKIYIELEEPEKQITGINILEKLSESDPDDKIYYQLGKIYLDPSYGHVDIEKGMKYLEASAEQGNEYAQYRIGKIYLDPSYGHVDIEKGMKYLEASAEQGNEYAQYRIGKIYLDPSYGHVNIEKGMKYLEASADQGNEYAQYRIGKIYLDPSYGHVDIEKGMGYLEASAEQGNQYAQLSLGIIYLKGRYVARDAEKGKEYLKKSAEQGNQIAEDILKHPNKVHRISFKYEKEVLRQLHRTLNISMNKLKKSLDQETQKWINMRRFEELQRELKQERTEGLSPE